MATRKKDTSRTKAAPSSRSRQTIRGKNWKASTSIAKEKFDAIAGAVLKILKKDGMRWGTLVDEVAERLPKFEGSIPWYTTSVLRELETQGKVRREIGPPALYSKLKKR